jgi:protein SCO1/2
LRVIAGSLTGGARAAEGNVGYFAAAMNRAAAAVLVIAAALAGAVTAFLVTRPGAAPPALERATRLDAPRPLPAVTLLDQAGAAWGPDRLRGRWTLLFFGFTHCPDVCPTTLATLAGARRLLSDLPAGEQPGLLFATVDPARDTPQALAQYVGHFDPAFAGVTGDAAEIGRLTREMGVAVHIGAADADGRYAVDHSAAVFLVDPDAAYSALFGAPHDAAVIARDYRLLVAARGR